MNINEFHNPFVYIKVYILVYCNLNFLCNSFVFFYMDAIFNRYLGIISNK